MSCSPILNADRGSWCWWRAVAHQSSSVLLVFNWRWLGDIQLCTSSMHADRRCWKSRIAGGLVEPYIWVSSAYRWGQKRCCITSAIRSAANFLADFGILYVQARTHLVHYPLSFIAVGWVIWPVKLSSKWPIMCRVKPFKTIAYQCLNDNLCSVTSS